MNRDSRFYSVTYFARSEKQLFVKKFIKEDNSASSSTRFVFLCLQRAHGCLFSTKNFLHSDVKSTLNNVHFFFHTDEHSVVFDESVQEGGSREKEEGRIGEDGYIGERWSEESGCNSWEGEKSQGHEGGAIGGPCESSSFLSTERKGTQGTIQDTCSGAAGQVN